MTSQYVQPLFKRKTPLLITKMLLIAAIFLVIPIKAFALTPIAHTDVVPYQRIDHGTSFNFGVVAFSKPGINRVQFAISGQGYTGGVKTSSSMALNTRVKSAEYDGVWEYFVTISASEFTGNGPITVRPTVYDNGGNTRVLDAVTLIVEGASANFNQREAWVSSASDGTGTVGNRNDPFPTIQAAVSAAQSANGGTSSGNTIYLNEGTYSISGLSASTSGEWLTITKASGADRNRVIINQGRPNVNGLKLDQVTLQSRGSAQEVLSSNSLRQWTNSCRLIGSGREISRSNPVSINLQSTSATGKYYSTDDYTYDVNYAYHSITLIRGAIVEKVQDDVFENFLFVVNSKVNDVTNGPSNAHSDVLQVYHVNSGDIPVSNRLAYNVHATDIHYQGIMRASNIGAPHDNAYINVFIEMRNPGEPGSAGGIPQLQAALSNTADDHLLVWHCTFPYAQTTWGNRATNSSFIGNLFWQDLSNSSQLASTDWLHNHYMYIYGGNESCTPTSKDLAQGAPCPHWHSSVKDSGSSTASTGSGVVDISNPGAANFGYPIAGSTVVNALPRTYVPVDALGNRRDSRPDIGALEYGASTPTTPNVPNPTGLRVVE